MRKTSMCSVALCALALATPARAEPAPVLQPTPPAASPQIYIKVKNQELVEYCKAEHLGVPRCNPGKMFEATDVCAAPYKVGAVSCGLSDLGSEPRLVISGSDAKQAAGACVWSFEKYPAEKAPQATTTLLCVK